MEELGVGRSTLREAVRVLAHNGILEVHQGDGTSVRSFPAAGEPLMIRLRRAQVREIQEVRRTLEIEIVRLAADAAHGRRPGADPQLSGTEKERSYGRQHRFSVRCRHSLPLRRGRGRRQRSSYRSLSCLCALLFAMPLPHSGTPWTGCNEIPARSARHGSCQGRGESGIECHGMKQICVIRCDFVSFAFPDYYSDSQRGVGEKTDDDIIFVMC